MKLAPMKRVGMLGLAAASVWLVGCDDTSAPNKSVKQNLATSETELAKVDSLAYQKDPTTASAALKAAVQAAGESAADPLWRAAAAGSAGDISAAIATTQLAELTQIEQNVRRELSKLRVLTQQVAFINTINAGHAASDPSAQIARIEGMIKSMQGDAQTTTWLPLAATAGADGKVVSEPGKAGAVPTLAAIKQEISRLEGEIASRKDQIAKLNADRQAALAEAEKRFAEADKAKGNQSVALFTEGANARKKSEEIAMQTDLVQDQLNRLEADLAVAKGQEQATNTAISQLQEQLATIQAGWKSTQDSMSKQSAIAETALKGGETVTMSIDTSSTEVAKQLALAKEKRAQVLEQLGDAAKYYKQAADAGSKVGTDKRVTMPPPSNKAYKDLKESVHTGRFNLPLGGVQRAIGTVSADQAALALEIERVSADLRKELSAANLATPSDLQSISMDEIKSAITAAEEKLNESRNTLINVNSGDTPKPVARASLGSQYLTIHRLISLEQLKQKMDGAANAAQIQTLMTDAAQLRQEMVQEGVTVPSVPGMPAGPTRSPANPETPTPPANLETPTPPDNTNVEPATPPADQGGFGGG